jgi:hypothetical protein
MAVYPSLRVGNLVVGAAAQQPLNKMRLTGHGMRLV